MIWFLQVFLLQLEARRNFETFIVEYLRPRALFKHWQICHENSNKDKVGVTFTFQWKWKIPLTAPSRLRRPWAPPADSFVPLVLGDRRAGVPPSWSSSGDEEDCNGDAPCMLLLWMGVSIRIHIEKKWRSGRVLLIPDSLTDYQTMKDMSTQLLKRRSGALITGEGKYVFCRGEAKWSRKMRKT